jgi:replicative DNA helicase
MNDLDKPIYNTEAEQAVLGGLLLDNEAWDRVADLVRENDFSSRDHRMIFRAIFRLLDDGKPADILMVADFLDRQKSLEDAGGIVYLGSLAQNTPSAANIVRYAEIVREYSVLRQIRAVTVEISEKVMARGDLTSKDVLDFAQSRMMSISESAQKQGGTMKHASLVMDSVLRNIDELMSNPNPSDVTGLPSGLIDLDKMTTGFQPGELIVIAARPSMGKTSLALNFVEHAALIAGKRTVVFSLEMINDQLGMRLLSSLAHVPSQRVRVGRLYDDEFNRVFQAADRLRKTTIYLDEESNISVTELRARARRLHRECGGLDLIVIDYLQLMAHDGNIENEAIALAKISRGLKLLAKELHVPVIALSQLNRGLEQRPNKRPIMSDLRGSGGIEQDADMILFIYRDEVYNQDSPDRGIAEIIIGKQRNGPIGTVHTAFIGHLMRFDNLAHGQVIPSQQYDNQPRTRRAGSSAPRNEDTNA